MEIKLERKYYKTQYTIGNLYINNKFVCNTLEDTWRDLNKVPKVYGQTAIPEGRYRVVMTWWNKYNKEIPILLNVPYFEGILIHAGNTAKDTEGCILVGENKVKGQVVNSQYHSQIISEMISEAIDLNEKVFITII